MSYKNVCVSLLCSALLMTSQLSAEEVAEDMATDITKDSATNRPTFDTEVTGVPFIISTETLGAAVGVSGIIKHAGQPQASIFGLGLYSDNDSNIGFISFNNYVLPGLTQWLFSTEYYRGYFSNGIYYVPAPGEPQSTNEIIAEGTDSSLRIKAKYVLPWGLGANGAARSLMQQRGEIAAFNPLESGVTSVSFTPFQQKRDVTGYVNLPDVAQGLELQLNWDNRDSIGDTEAGSQTRFTVRRDFGNDERNSWTTWELEQSAFVPLDANSLFKEQVLAFNYYLADTPTWNSGTGVADKHRPPSFAGIKLGGFNRLRGYSSGQFYSRSAVVYSAEYRVKPHWQPLHNLPFYDFPWWQWSAFVETGQVADSFDLSALHDDLKWTAGLGLRLNVEGVLVRIDYAKSEHDAQMWFMINQPF
ncbi:MAG: BamA/TamA family outer membrane protein [Moritella sp.]|uniref:BamA/TamA family outer membrane protein n=1 Tax=Moritella sp. TaxID=78556 RepID=UPI0025D78BD4|nr:BamA/TamA family outer membrane protein [Moritella sp.]NQZ93259.1 BamA/TamA family outer membrane protein [Moritella sp.]